MSENKTVDDSVFQSIIDMIDIPVVKAPIFKLYYDENGNVITYTTDECVGNYIIITAAQFAEARPDVVVKHGKIIYTHKQTHVFKLEKSVKGRRCSKYDVSIIDETGDIMWEQVVYEII